MSVFCRRIKGMLCSKVTVDSYICGLPTKHLQINPYMYWFMRTIRTFMDFWKKSVQWEKFLRIRVRIFFWIRKTQKWWNFHRMVQCYGLMLHIAVTCHSNFLHLVTLLRTVLVTQWCYIIALHYCVILHVCTNLYTHDLTIYTGTECIDTNTCPTLLSGQVASLHVLQKSCADLRAQF